MDWGYKAVLTAAMVGLILVGVERFGHALAGLLAGLPVITIPSLIWIDMEQGSAFAAEAAIGSVAACAALAAFAIGYQRSARRGWSAPTSLSAGLFSAAVVAGPLSTLPILAPIAVVVAAWAIVVARLAMQPAAQPVVKPVSITTPAMPHVRTVVTSATVAGITSALVAVLAPYVGPFWSGLFASLPLISAVAVVHQHRRSGPRSVTPFLRGYVEGLVLKSVFGITFAIAIPDQPVALALIASLCVCVLVSRLGRVIRGLLDTRVDAHPRTA